MITTARFKSALPALAHPCMLHRPCDNTVQNSFRTWQWMGRVLLAVTAVACGPTRGWAAQPAVAVILSSHQGPYQEALKGFQAAYGQPVPLYSLSEGPIHISSQTRIFVAIGGKAALYKGYPAHGTLIYGLAPGIKLRSDAYAGRVFKIHTSPTLYQTISKLKQLQPGLKHLAVLWSGDSIQDYFDQQQEILIKLRVEVISDHVKDLDKLPAHLRALNGKVDAIWLPSDSAMITPESFNTIRDFSLANHVPFYVPTPGLASQGALASISVPFSDLGALAASKARQAETNELEGESASPENARLAVNLGAAKAIQFQIPLSVLDQDETLNP